VTNSRDEPPSDPTAVVRRRSDRVSRECSLVDLRVRRLEGDLLTPVGEPPLTLELTTLSVELGVGRLTGLAIYDVKYLLSAMDANNELAVRVELVLNLVFSLSAGLLEEPDLNADLQAFGSVAVLEIGHPYVREIVHSLTARMGIPPLVLDVNPPIV
jgi:hypothetical protein